MIYFFINIIQFMNIKKERGKNFRINEITNGIQHLNQGFSFVNI